MAARQRIPRPPGARAGGPAPWAGLGAAPPLKLAVVRRAMAAVPPAEPPGPPPVPVAAAVLVTLFEEHGRSRVILTRRSSRLRTHRAEIAFPGGRLEEGELPVMAALREAGEEVGLEPGLVEVVGQLAPVVAVSSAAFVTPFVGLLGARPGLRPDPAEVEHAFDVSLADMVVDGVHHEERWDLPGRPNTAVHFFDLGEDVVWGATAAVLFELLSLVTERLPAA